MATGRVTLDDSLTSCTSFFCLAMVSNDMSQIICSGESTVFSSTNIDISRYFTEGNADLGRGLAGGVGLGVDQCL